MKKVFTLILLIGTFHSLAQIGPGNVIRVNSDTMKLGSLDTFNLCPPLGKTSELRLQELNRQKNRYNMPLPTDFYKAITLDPILELGNDVNRWEINKAVELTAYVFEVKPRRNRGLQLRCDGSCFYRYPYCINCRSKHNHGQ